MQVKDLIVTGDAKILGNLYANGGSVSGSGGSGSSDGSGLTYKLTKSGSTITLTGSDGSTSSVTDANTDTNTTYSAGTGISLSGTTFSNSGVRSIATGSSNGTISVNTNGTSANVAVKGLGSAAYTASTAYAASSHSHDDRYFTESEINSKLSGYSTTGHTHSYAPISHTQAASTITAGTFAGQVVAKSSGQAVGTSLLRNSKLVSTATYATVNGEINWLYG